MIELHNIPECPIPAGMKRGTPAYEYRSPVKSDWVLTEDGWRQNKYGNVWLVANFVPIEPEESRFIDSPVTLDSDYNVYRCLTPQSIEYTILFAMADEDFVEYLWIDSDGDIQWKDSQHCRMDNGTLCTHVRFKNPKFKDGAK